MERIHNLREIALKTDVCFDEFYYHFYREFLNSKNPIKAERYADAYYTAFSVLTPSISDGELIVGKCDNIMSPTEKTEWKDK